MGGALVLALAMKAFGMWEKEKVVDFFRGQKFKYEIQCGGFIEVRASELGAVKWLLVRAPPGVDNLAYILTPKATTLSRMSRPSQFVQVLKPGFSNSSRLATRLL